MVKGKVKGVIGSQVFLDFGFKLRKKENIFYYNLYFFGL